MDISGIEKKSELYKRVQQDIRDLLDDLADKKTSSIQNYLYNKTEVRGFAKRVKRKRHQEIFMRVCACAFIVSIILALLI